MALIDHHDRTSYSLIEPGPKIANVFSNTCNARYKRWRRMLHKVIKDSIRRRIFIGTDNGLPGDAATLLSQPFYR